MAWNAVRPENSPGEPVRHTSRERASGSGFSDQTACGPGLRGKRKACMTAGAGKITAILRADPRCTGCRARRK